MYFKDFMDFVKSGDGLSIGNTLRPDTIRFIEHMDNEPEARCLIQGPLGSGKSLKAQLLFLYTLALCLDDPHPQKTMLVSNAGSLEFVTNLPSHFRGVSAAIKQSPFFLYHGANFQSNGEVTFPRNIRVTCLRHPDQVAGCNIVGAYFEDDSFADYNKFGKGSDFFKMTWLRMQSRFRRNGAINHDDNWPKIRLAYVFQEGTEIDQLASWFDGMLEGSVSWQDGLGPEKWTERDE